MNRADTGVIQGGGGASFTLEALQRCGMRRESRRQEFDCYRPVQARVPGFVDLAHAAFLEKLLHHVRPDPRAHGNRRFLCLVHSLRFVAFQEAGRPVVVRQQRLHFAAQRIVPGTGAVQICPPLRGLLLARRMV